MVTYFKKLSKLFLDIEVTDKRDKSIQVSSALRNAIDLIKRRSSAGNKIIFIGNGGSASIASHMAIDFWKNGRMKAVCFNDSAQLTCLGNDFGYECVFEKPIQFFAEAGDVLVAISSSGKSENILRGVRAAKDKKCKVITMSGFDKNNPLRKMGDLNFYVPAKSYGLVEITHLTLCHFFLDTIIETTLPERPR